MLLVRLPTKMQNCLSDRSHICLFYLLKKYAFSLAQPSHHTSLRLKQADVHGCFQIRTRTVTSNTHRTLTNVLLQLPSYSHTNYLWKEKDAFTLFQSFSLSLLLVKAANAELGHWLSVQWSIAAQFLFSLVHTSGSLVCTPQFYTLVFITQLPSTSKFTQSSQDLSKWSRAAPSCSLSEFPYDLLKPDRRFIVRMIRFLFTFCSVNQPNTRTTSGHFITAFQFLEINLITFSRQLRKICVFRF